MTKKAKAQANEKVCNIPGTTIDAFLEDMLQFQDN